MNQSPTSINTLIDNACCDLESIRQQQPIIHNITNLVAISTTANLLLAIGASPIMAHAKAELADISAIAHSLVINMGTLDETWVQAATYSQQQASKQNIPIIFDPVGAGASQYRTQTAKKILHDGVQVLRGNPSEVIALANSDHIKTKGVDSCHQSDDAREAGKIISKQYKCKVVISGKTDIIITDDNEAYIPYGTTLLTKVTGMGCAATAIIAAFAAINQDYFQAATHAMTLFTLAGQIAAMNSQGPASFHNRLVDILFSLKKEDIQTLVEARLDQHS